MNILLVDDDIFIRAYLHHVLISRGHSVIECTDGLEALAFAGNPTIHVAVVDVVLPEMDGVALVKQLKHRSPSLAIVGITGGFDDMWPDGQSRLKMMIEVGADMVLEKPFDEKTFLAAIETSAAKYCGEKSK